VARLRARILPEVTLLLIGTSGGSGNSGSEHGEARAFGGGNCPSRGRGATGQEVFGVRPTPSAPPAGLLYYTPSIPNAKRDAGNSPLMADPAKPHHRFVFLNSSTSLAVISM
jgi:hypothetical protein